MKRNTKIGGRRNRESVSKKERERQTERERETERERGKS